MTVLHADLPGDERLPVTWCQYRGDQRGILNPANNPVVTFQPGFDSPFGHIAGHANNVAGAGLTMAMRGPNTLGEPMWPVVADYDDDTNRTRVGWSYVRPTT